MGIKEVYQRIRSEVPSNVTIVLAGKGRSVDEIKEAISAGCTDIGENYVQEALLMHTLLGSSDVKWHVIGHVQSNKIGKILSISDCVQTIDSESTASMFDKRAGLLGKKIPVLIEINIGEEENKSGIMPELSLLKELCIAISKMENLKLDGLMTMGPLVKNPEELRPYFKKIKGLFDELNNSGFELKTLSMGMSDSYKIAIEEGSNMIRLGTIVFGERH
jgi:pyridoxal phosphate enzyme (YggS family)